MQLPLCLRWLVRFQLVIMWTTTTRRLSSSLWSSQTLTHSLAAGFTPSTKIGVQRCALGSRHRVLATTWRYTTTLNKGGAITRYISPTTTITRSATSLQARKKATLSDDTEEAATATIATKNQQKQQQRYHLVIVESPSKCTTIEKILQAHAQNANLPYSFVVTSCLGHIRNLPSKEDNAAKKDKQRSSRFPYAIVGIDLDRQYAPTYEIIPGKEKVVRELQRLAAQADKILLATDPDREGEAMAWHLQQILVDNHNNIHNNNKKQPSPPMERISFTEITPSAVQYAVEHPVSINPGLVQAQETRRILDRLAGFTVSPLLWKKIAPGLSAGRVQSVGMALVVQRERERLLFEPTKYWSIHASFWEQQTNLTAQLFMLDNVPVASSGKDFASRGQVLAEGSAHKLHLHDNITDQYVNLFRDKNTEWKVIQVKATQRQQQPPQPYRTSTLQQDVNRRLGLGVEQCMRTAQELYENGLISYMRTDATHLSADAEISVQQAIVSAYGNDMYEPSRQKGGASSKRKKESKFAQEAHEAIRPAIQSDGTFLRPDTLATSQVAKDLYRMIYQRTLACRMPNLITNLTQVSIQGTTVHGTVGVFRLSGSVVISPGYTAAYGALEEDDDDEDGDGENGGEKPGKKRLPEMTEGQILENTSVEGMEHETQPPPRYNEASFVKQLEALGVGRPSTYAGIVKILRERAYVGSPSSSNKVRASRKEVSGPAISALRAAGGEQFAGSAKGSLVPSLSAFAVCSLLEENLPNYVDSDFTARMEERLDHIANSESSSEEERLRYLEEFYGGNEGLAAIVKRVEDTVGGEGLRSVDLPTLHETRINGESDNLEEDIQLLVGPWGPYIQGKGSNGEVISAPLRPDMAADLSKINLKTLRAILSTKEAGGYLLGIHLEDGRNIRLKTGRFGPYLQCGDDDEPNTTTHSLPRGLPLSSAFEDDEVNSENPAHDYPPNMPILTFEEALGFVSLPKVIGFLDESPITAAVGPYGPYLKCNSTYVNLDVAKDIITIDEDSAVELMREAMASGGKRKPRGVLAELGEMDGSPVRVKSGRFGPYISWKRTNVKLPDTYSEDNMPSLEEAWDLVREKLESEGRAPKGIAKGSSTQGPSVELPPAPKRPPSAYLLYCSEKREELADQSLSFGETARLLSTLWSELPENEKEKFEEEAGKRKTEYEKEKQAWKVECQRMLKDVPITKDSKNGMKKLAKENLPKRPKSSYLFFREEKRPEISTDNKSLGEISKELSSLWRSTTDRTKYERLAEEDKARYEAELNSTKEVAQRSGPSKKTKTTVSKKSKKKTTSKAKAEIKVKRPPSAYMLFCKETRPTLVDDDGNKLPLGEGTKMLATMWKSCDSATRKKFEKLAQEEKEKARRTVSTK